MVNKKGAEMTIGTIIVIILALVVLVVLIYGFSTGWSNLWQNIVGYGGGSVNVQSVVDSCNLACTTQSTYDFCTKPRNLVFDQVNNKANPSNGVYTCFQLSNNNPVNVGLSSCSSIDCSSVGAGIKGTCTGTPSPNCASGTSGGKASCEGSDGVYGCKWTSNVATTDSTYGNIGTGSCVIDTTLKCVNYVNNRDACNKLSGCTFNQAS